jgi:aryl-alcohol dehydrogenase-like predicted oxidoreductase
VKKRKLGETGLEIAPLGFGGNVLGWTADEPASFSLLDAFVAAGFNLIDTSDAYYQWAPGHQAGESEAVIGKWFRRSGNRDKVVLATKVGMELSPGEGGLSRPHILRAVEASLRRLQTDYIDLYQTHKDDGTTPPEETLGAYAELLRQGKVRAIGASNYTPERLARSLEVGRDLGLPRYGCYQTLYNLYDRAPFEEQFEPICRQAGLGVLTYFSLASGFLTGKYRSEQDLAKSARGQGVKKYLNERGLRILGALDEVAARNESTPARVALAWLMARPAVTAPLSSATSLAQLDDQIQSTRLELDEAALRRLNEASA